VDGKTWQTVKDNLDKSFSIVGPARYEYRLRCQLEGPARLRRLAITNDLQMAPLAMPEMAVGENTFIYSDQVSGYFDLEKPFFGLEEGPAWLKIDGATGLLSGVPDAAGKAEVAVVATIDRDVRKLDEQVLIGVTKKCS